MGFLRGFSIIMGANGLLFVLSFLNNKLLYITLDESANGLYFIIMRSTLLVSMFAGDWIRLSTMHQAGTDRSLTARLSANGAWYIGVLAVLAVTTLGVAHAAGAGWNLEPSYLIPIGIGIALGLIARNFWMGLLLVNERLMAYGITIVLWGAVMLALDAVLLLVFRLGLGAVIVSLAVATAISLVWSFVASARNSGHSFRPSKPLFRSSWRIGRRAGVAIAGTFLMLNLQTFIIPYITGSEAAGLAFVALYSVSYRLFALIQRSADIACNILYSHVVRKDAAAGALLTREVTRHSILIAGLLSLVCAAAGKYIIVIIADTKYIAAYSSLLCMLPGIVAVSGASLINAFYWGRGYPLWTITTPYIAGLAGVALTLLLVPRFGLPGATGAFSLMTVGWLIYLARRFSKDTGFALRDVLVPRPADVRIMAARLRRGLKSLRGARG